MTREGTIIPFLDEVTLDQDLAWRSPRHDISVHVDDFGSDVRKDLSYSFDSLGDWICRRRLERHGTA